MSNQLTKLSVILLSCTSTLLFASSYYSSDYDYNQNEYSQFLSSEDTAKTDDEKLDNMLEDFVKLLAKKQQAKHEESVSSIFDQSLTISETALSTLQGVNNQCQQTLQTNFMYKDQLADLGGKYKQSDIRANICECVADDAMENISEDHLEKASNNPKYQRKLITNTVEGSLFGCYNKVVNNWKLKP